MTTYSISLDDVELALLPTRTYTNDFLKKDLFEFQLLAREEEKDLPIYTSYTCDICAIEVPAPFSNEHVASVKHQANVRITTEAAQRMRALITATPPPLAPRAAERFCDSCTCIVGKDHEKTKEHRVSVTQDRMLCDLANLYIGDEDLVDVKENEQKNDKDKKHLTKDEDKVTTKDITKVDRNVAKLTNTRTDETGQKQNALKTKEINNKPTAEQETLYGHCTELVQFSVAVYIKILKQATSSPKIKVKATGDKIYVLVNTEKMIVSYDRFNGYHRMGGKILCDLCKYSFDEAYEKVHKLTVTHVRSVMDVVDDSHCIREIHDWWSHCILCNEVIWKSEVEEHKHSQEHLEKKREATVSQVETNNKQGKKLHALANIPQVKFTNTTVPDQNLAQKVAQNIQIKPTDVTVPNQTLPQNAVKNIAEVIPKNITVPNQNLPHNAAKNIPEVKLKNVTELFPKFCNFGNSSVTLPATNSSELNAKNKVLPNNSVPLSAANKTPELKGKNKAVPNENQETIVTHVYLDSEHDINYPYAAESISSVRCVICDCSVPIYYNNRKDHLNGNRHAANLKKQFPPIE